MKILDCLVCLVAAIAVIVFLTICSDSHFTLWEFMIPTVHYNLLIRWGLINSHSDSRKQIACTH